MKKTIQAAAVVLLAASPAHAQQAVQWRVEDGGNGHWYAFRSSANPTCWSSARTASSAEGGHLVTLTTENENSWVRDSVVIPNSIGCQQLGPYTGGTCEGRDWGQWYWITGEPFTYSGFDNGEPNSGGGEQYIHFWVYCQGLHWNDTTRCSSRCWVVEWSADCNNDGIVDYGQILDGTFPDGNSNGVPDCCEGGGSCCVGDILADGVINGADLGALLFYWGPVSSSPASRACDLNRDGEVTGADLGLLLAGWGACP